MARKSNGEQLTGTKGGSGVAQRIISEIPWHEVYVEPFYGRGTIGRKMRPASLRVGCDLDEHAHAHGQQHGFTMFRTCGIQWLKDYFRSSVAGSCDASSLLPFGYPASQHFVYLDPPYWLTRTDVRNYYHHTLTEAQHIDLCRLFLALPCPAALSGYHSPLYDHELANVRHININTRTRRGPATEVVWFNYDPPALFHDVSKVGRNKIDRERIARRCRTWPAALLRMPRRERQAVFESCLAAIVAPPAAAAFTSDALRLLALATERHPGRDVERGG